MFAGPGWRKTFGRPGFPAGAHRAPALHEVQLQLSSSICLTAHCQRHPPRLSLRTALSLALLHASAAPPAPCPSIEPSRVSASAPHSWVLAGWQSDVAPRIFGSPHGRPRPCSRHDVVPGRMWCGHRRSWPRAPCAGHDFGMRFAGLELLVEACPLPGGGSNPPLLCSRAGTIDAVRYAVDPKMSKFQGTGVWSFIKAAKVRRRACGCPQQQQAARPRLPHPRPRPAAGAQRRAA